MNTETHFIGGEWKASHGRDRLPLVNPSTGETQGWVCAADEVDVASAVDSARAALASSAWSTMSLAGRIEAVQSMKQWILAHRESLASDIAVGLGQPMSVARTLGGAPDMIDMYAESAKQVPTRYLRSDATGYALIRRRPVGVTAAITPWNTPVRGEMKKVVAGLLAGCTVVLKPAPESTVGGRAIAEAAMFADLPAGVVNVVFGGPHTGAALVSNRGLNKVGFTGSTATGTRIAQACAHNMTRVQLELGGKSPAVLLDDCDIATAAEMVGKNAFFYAGQTCTALTRVIAPRRMAAEISAALVDIATQYRLGDATDERTTMGPLVSARQLDKVLSYVDIGVSEGARLLTGGRRPAALVDGFFVEPAVFTDVRNDMRIAREEIFGPVVCVIAYDSIDEAVEIANDSLYGLAGAVFGADEERAFSIAQRLDSGTVAVNRVGRINSAPFGGTKRSGLGREQGPEAFDAHLEYQAVAVSAETFDRLARAGLPPDPHFLRA